jgi:hypothetical protein
MLASINMLEGASYRVATVDPKKKELATCVNWLDPASLVREHQKGYRGRFIVVKHVQVSCYCILGE